MVMPQGYIAGSGTQPKEVNDKILIVGAGFPARISQNKEIFSSPQRDGMRPLQTLSGYFYVLL